MARPIPVGKMYSVILTERVESHMTQEVDESHLHHGTCSFKVKVIFSSYSFYFPYIVFLMRERKLNSNLFHP